ncbi:MAG TPA: hypothetical protein DCQ26_09915 [Marinilabiliales bacterium]|nr:MAG: hypothetical protein A2W84_09250 [Bacteroidetes bacterium GWC2_40_13]OFX73215.1 MAG: hypothetical protein A2W96_07075 [Bacteroidetes bacterium GWD2_40_43]OFX92070.1 MAG: hypothetical protein A2W97_08365 [Bacteroidetes bacterium GWE2_40_63]OFY16694.1 MAG: hypothetical protein A2W88_16040 [Bacteroidetes bacterium GWF2_40_13]OFZ30590.1 MAG: hypothetical protein A2437_02725 [Bacteroidetes bacterium RIFOXYC2_FULL_40_12]HAM98911.1 hypothetical protein [Marinilabiliales bacterium]
MKRNLIIASAIITLAVVAGCRGSQQNKLIGIWEKIPFSEPTSQSTYWQFFAGEALWVFDLDTTISATDTLNLIKYTYSIDGNIFEIFGEGDYGTAAGDPRGEYWVDELNNDYFKVTKRKHPDGTTDAAYLRIELAKR